MRDLLRLARILAAAAALAAMTACMGTEKPVVEATGVPVGGGVNVPAGSNEDFIVNVGRRTYFAANSAELDEVAKVTLQKQANWLARYTGYKIKIEGFADDGGSADRRPGIDWVRRHEWLCRPAQPGHDPPLLANAGQDEGGRPAGIGKNLSLDSGDRGSLLITANQPFGERFSLTRS